MLLGLGTNLGDRAANLRAAITGLSAFGVVDRLSSVYESEPYGFADQPHFWNMAARLRTRLPPRPLLDGLKDLERAIGREPTHRMGPRVIDIDILLYGDARMETPGLKIPHPGLADRAFVLQPLLELEPQLRHPASGVALADELSALPEPHAIRLGAADAVLGITIPEPS